jgi:hypothetical protein
MCHLWFCWPSTRTLSLRQSIKIYAHLALKTKLPDGITSRTLSQCWPSYPKIMPNFPPFLIRPFYLDHIVSLRKIHSHQNSKKLTANNLTTVIPPKERIRSETFRGSRLSLRGDSGGGGGGIGAGINSTNEIGQLFPSYDLFTNTNPRTL